MIALLNGTLRPGRLASQEGLLAQQLLREGAPADLRQPTPFQALSVAAPLLPHLELTLSRNEHRLLLEAQRTEVEHLAAGAFLQRLHDLTPGAAAWLLIQLDVLFGDVAPFTTPAWARRTIRHMIGGTPESRRRQYNARNDTHFSARKTERLIHCSGCWTSYSIEQGFGRWLLPERACSDPQGRAALKTLSPRIQTLLQHTATWLDADCVKRDVEVPAFCLHLEADDDDFSLTDEISEHMAQHWRYGASSFTVDLRSAAQMRRTYRQLARRVDAAFEIAWLLKEH